MFRVDPAERFFFGGGGANLGGGGLTYPHFQVSPRIYRTLYFEIAEFGHLFLFYFMLNFQVYLVNFFFGGGNRPF